MYMINVSEQVQRPKDMLMFLGEYFKAVIDRTQKVYNDNKDEKESQKTQVDFFITFEIMNSLGTACKMYIDRQRQELRMSIALSRSPVFQTKDQLHAIFENIVETQKSIINDCDKLFKLIDYTHDRKYIVPLKYMNQQPPKSTLNALFYKMKADYLRYIYECLSGDNGVLYGITNTEDFTDLLKSRAKKEISLDELHQKVKCEYCYIIERENQRLKDEGKEDEGDQYTLLEFMEHEVFHQYELAMREICQSKENNYERVNIVDGKPGIQEQGPVPFHPVFLSALLNQQVFKRDVEMQKIRENVQGFKNDFDVIKAKKEVN